MLQPACPPSWLPFASCWALILPGQGGGHLRSPQGLTLVLAQDHKSCWRGCGDWGWQLGRGGEWGGPVLVHAALAGSSAQLRAGRRAGGPAGGVLTVFAFVQAHQMEGPPPREPSLGGVHVGDLDPSPGNWGTTRIDTEVTPPDRKSRTEKPAPPGVGGETPFPGWVNSPLLWHRESQKQNPLPQRTTDPCIPPQGAEAQTLQEGEPDPLTPSGQTQK